MSSVAYAALWCFVFSIPWEKVIVINNMSIVTRLTGALALSLAMLAVVIQARFRRWHAFHVAALMFVLYAGITLFVLGIPIIPSKFWTFVQLFLVLWMTWELAVSKRRMTGLLTAYVYGAYVAAFATIWVYVTEGGSLRRFAAAEADPNDLAMTVALALPMAWFLGMTHRQMLLRWIFRAYLPIGLLVIGLTGSRGGMLAGLFALLIVPLTMTRLSPGRLVTAIAMLGLSGVLAVSYVPEQTVARLATTGAEFQDLSLGGRFKLWRAGLIAFTEKPVLGFGTSGFRTAVKPILGAFTQVAHNSFLSVLVEQGIVGFLLYMAMLGAVFWAALSLPRLERRFALILLGTLCLAMLPLTWEDQKQVWLVMATLIGLSRAQDLAVSREASEPVTYYPVSPLESPSLAAHYSQGWSPPNRPLGGSPRP
jgi:O-antigen ligase